MHVGKIPNKCFALLNSKLYRAGLKKKWSAGCENFSAKAEGGKQQQEQNSPNVGTTLLAHHCIKTKANLYEGEEGLLALG